MTTRTIIAVFLAATLTTLVATRHPLAARNSSEVIPQSTVPMLTGTTQLIKATLGDQTNPHVACNIATYTEDDFQGNSIIKYFDFATNTEHTVPGNHLDRLSDTDGRRIAFSQLEAGGDHVVLYDIATQTATDIPVIGSFAPAIGGNLVAFARGNSTTPSTFEISA